MSVPSLNNTHLTGRFYRGFNQLRPLCFQILLHLLARVGRALVHPEKIGSSGVQEAPKVPDISQDLVIGLSSEEGC